MALGYDEVALEDFWGVFLHELDNLPNMEMTQLEVQHVVSNTEDGTEKTFAHTLS